MDSFVQRLLRRLKGFGPEAWSWMSYDFANSAFATSITAVIFNQYYAGVIAGGPRGTDFNLFGWEFNLPGASLFQFSILFGTLLTVLLSPFLGIYADLAGHRKKLLIIVTIIGGTFTALLAFIEPGDVILGGIIYGLALCMFYLGLVFYNSFLPQICAARDIGLVSGFSWALGYIGGGLCLLLNLIMLESPELIGFEEGRFTVGYVIVMVALWWLIFSLPTFFGVKERPPRANPLGDRPSPRLVVRNLLQTLRRMRRFRQLWIFLLAYLFFTNGIETTISSASIFGNEELKMSTGSLITLFLLVQFTAFPGALIFGFLSDRFGDKKALTVALWIWIAALLLVHQLGIIWDPVTEFYIAAVMVGIVLGGSQAAARSLFAAFTPPERAAEFFSFYGIAGRLAATLGPLSFAAVNIITRDLRHSIVTLVVFFLLGLLVLSRVNENEGKLAARRPF